MKKTLSLLSVLVGLSTSAWAVDVTVTMNTVSPTMSLTSSADDALVDVGAPTNRVYKFSVDEGTYVLTGYATDGTTVNGTIVLNVSESENDFKVFTATAYATNSGWTLGTDYTISQKVVSKQGETLTTTLGNSITAGRATFLMLNGNSYYCDYIPSSAHQAEGYMTGYKYATVTSNPTASQAIPVGYEWTASVPKDAELFIGRKTSHFIPFFGVEPNSVTVEGDKKVYSFTLANGQVYNYRAKKSANVPLAGYFTMNADASKVPTFNFTDADFSAFGLKTINHDVHSNGGYETGDIFLRANEKGHISMSMNEERDMLALRSWQLTDNSTNNYFIEPDFHYTVINTEGQPDNSVITLDRYTTDQDPWVKMKAVGNGTAIVLVTYDAINLNYYSGTTKTPYLGGENWGAIWPENTGVYVVTVGDDASAIDANMVINEKYNTGTLKNAGKYVDAEHDVFYYLDTEAGFEYTFTPSGVASVEIAYPSIGAEMATYNGFATEGVTKNEDGSYTVLLKEGRQIVKLIGTDGTTAYQVLTAKSCHRDIINATRPGSAIFQPGDQVKIQYSGLRHPSNKMAGIYNMSGYITYNGIPNGSSLILGSGQYTFGSAASAQAVTVTIPSDWDPSVNPALTMDEGVIQVNGFGDPIGNHRNILKATGRNANFTAVSHKTYFGAIPSIEIPVTATRSLLADVKVTPEGAGILVRDASGKVVVKSKEDGLYHLTYGTYSVIGSAKGYRSFRGSFTLGDDAEDLTVVNMAFTPADESAWDGSSKTEPAIVDGVYQISNGAELAWFADNVNASKNYTSSAVLTSDIDLADYAWTPIGGATKATAFQGTFDGQGHSINGLYISSAATYQGLFGYCSLATVENFTLNGEVNSTGNYAAAVAAYISDTQLSGIINKATVSGKQYVGGINAYATNASTIDRCGNEANVSGTSTYVAGITPYAYAAATAVTNCYNTAAISGGNYTASLVANVGNNATVVKNNLGLGSVTSTGTYTGNVYAGTTTTRQGFADNYVSNNYAYGTAYETLATTEQLASGEIAIALGEAWGQEIGVDAYPILGGPKVYKGMNGYTNSTVEEYGEIAVLTFEDADSKGAVNVATGETTWSSMIDSEQYGGDILYDAYGENYWWYDENNTELMGGGNDWYMEYWTGGWAISDYYNKDIKNCGFTEQLSIPLEDNGNQFAVVYNYRSGSPFDMACATPLEFADGKAYVVESAEVMNTSYALGSLTYGDSFAAPASKDSWFAVNFEGTHEDGSVAVVTYKMADGRNFVTDWTKVDLTPLGAITSLNVYMTASADLCGDYGMNTPGYVAVDNIAVRKSGSLLLADKSLYDSEITTKAAQLTYTRTFGTTQWQPLYVPFASDYSAWSEDVEIAKIANVDGIADESLTIKYLEEGETVEANTPYFIRARKTGEVAIAVENAVLVPAENASITSGDVTLTGTFSPMTIAPDTYYVLQNGRFVKTSNEAGYNLPAMRWYATTESGAEIKIRVLDADATDIATVASGSAAKAIYSVNGQRLNTLGKGVNIIRMGDGTVKKVMSR